MSLDSRLANQLFFYSNALLVFTFCLPNVFFSGAIGLWGLAFIAQRFIRKKFDLKFIFSNPVSIAFIAIFLLQSIGLLFSESITTGLNSLEKSLLFLIAPLVLADFQYLRDKNKFIRNMLFVFVVSCVSVLLFMLTKATIDANLFPRLFGGNESISHIVGGLKWNFLYHNLSSKAALHAVYLSGYFIMAFFSAWQLIQSGFASKKTTTFLKVAMILLLIGLGLLTSSVMMFAFVVCLLLYLITRNQKIRIGLRIASAMAFSLSTYFLLYKFDFHHSIGIITPALIAAAFTGFIIPSILKYIPTKIGQPKVVLGLIIVGISLIFVVVSLHSVEAFVREHPSNVAARYWNWKSATQIILSNPILGTGTGNSIAYMLTEYQSYSFEGGLKYELNEHNQYLKFWMENGVLALLAFLYLIFSLLKGAWNLRYFPFTVLVVLLILFSFTESELIRRHGVSFFCYFAVLFGYANQLRLSFTQQKQL